MKYNSNIPTYSSSLEIIDPSTLFDDGYELTKQTVIESNDYQGSFTPGINVCEFYVYDANKTLITSNYNFNGLSVPDNPNPIGTFSPKTGKTSFSTTEILLNPETDISSAGFTFGKMYAVYNFVNPELGSSIEVPYYLAEISSDRTEIRLKSNFISTRTMKSTSVALRNSIVNPNYFDEIYISFGNNEYHIGINVKYDDSLVNQESNSGPVSATNAVGQSSILIKLYDALPTKYSLLDELYVCTKTAESQAYLVNFINDFRDDDEITILKGPNSNLKIQDFVNNSSVKQNKKELLGTKSSGSKDQLLNVLNQTGVQITPNYSTASFGEFINFSSAKSQVSNFIEKVSRIQSYEADLAVISSTTGSNIGNIPISESMASLWTKIEDEITAFSGFEYYQYYSTGSDAYPKSGTVFPFDLLPTQSALASNWILASEESGSLFDGDNQNWLYYTVPGFIKENSSNANYLEFTNMVGQSFDEVWLYTKAITERLNTTNDLDNGVPLQLADDVITSLGYTGFGNNYNNQDNFIGLIGSDNGVYVPPTGSELINHYIAVNGPGGVQLYWEDGYSYEDYVESFRNFGFPYPIDKVSKEIFKRLYHNMSYLVKKKGTVSGLRQLINIWGIPNTILRINEFGGKNKDEEDDYDLWYQRYSYAYSPVPAGTNYASSSVRIPWQPLQRNYLHSHNKLVSTTTLSSTGTTLTGATFGGVSGNYGIDTQFTVTGGGSGGKLALTANGSGVITTATLTQGDSRGYNVGSEITITAAQANALNDTAGIGTSIVGGPATFVVANANLGAEQIVPDGLGFRFKTTGYPSSSYGGNYTSQSLFIKKSTNPNTEADFGIVLNYTGSTSGSYDGSTSSKYVDYGEMRFFLRGSQAGGDTALSPPIYLPFFDKGWWNVQLQRDKHPIVTNNNENTTYTLFVANKIYDGNDGNQIGFQGSASIFVDVAGNANSASLNKSWNDFSIDLAAYGAGAYVGGWGNTLTTGQTGSMGILSSERLVPPPGGFGPKLIQRAGDNFSGSLQEFRYYSNDISQSVFNDAVMNPESIEGNFITGSESSFDIVNFRAPLGNELENIFTSSYTTQYTEQIESVHPAITGSSPLTITASFYNPAFPGNPTSSYDVTFNANSARRTFSSTNVETYFLDQPSIGIRNRVSNKIKYSTNLNFGTTLSNKVSIQQDPPISQSYTDNINSLEVAFSPTEEVNDDIIQALGYGSIQEVIADPRFRSSSDDYYPGLRSIADDYFKKYMNRSQIDYLRLIKYFDDSLFKAIKNYVPARTSVSTGIVIKQHMLERNRYREPQINIVTTQSYAPFNKPLTAKNLELTGSINTNQLWDPIKQTTYYSSSDPYNFEGGAGGSVNQYNVLEEGGGVYILEDDDLTITSTVESADTLLTGIVSAGTNITLTAAFGLPVGSIFISSPTSGVIVPKGTTITAKNNLTLQIKLSNNINLAGTGTSQLNFRTLPLSLLESVPLEEVSKDIVYINAGSIQNQATATIEFGISDQAANNTSNNLPRDSMCIIVESINPSGGPFITRKYCSSNSNPPSTGGGGAFVLWRGEFGSPSVKAASFVVAVNSEFGQGSGAAFPTLRAIVNPANTDQVILTQLYGGTDGNTAGITYGADLTQIGNPLTSNNLVPGTGYNGVTSTATSGGGNGFNGSPTGPTGASGLFYTITESGGVIATAIIDNTTGVSNENYQVGQTVTLTAGNGDAKLDIASVIPTVGISSAGSTGRPALFTGGTSAYNNVFLNALKSLRTPFYIDWDFSTDVSFQQPPLTIDIEISSSKRGIIFSNSTSYKINNPVGSILLDPQFRKQYFDMHPGEDIYIKSSTLDVKDIKALDYQVILGENITITTALAAETTAASTTLIIDNLSNDNIPQVGSIVTGPDIKSGVVTTLGAVQTAGTGYTPSTTQILATTGAGGGNLTLTVVTNASGNVTTAALSNPGTGYSTNDIVTIVGGDNNATVAISIATPKPARVDAFDPTTNTVTFNSAQSINDNSKVTFTVTDAIPDADTIPVSQQGYFVNAVTPEGIDTSWDDTQEQFYDGEYSGSNVIADQYYNNQYNPYRKVKPNSSPFVPLTVSVNTSLATRTNFSSYLGLSNNLTFATMNVGNPTGLALGITGLDIIPYQRYDVEYDVIINASPGAGPGAGNKVGLYIENFNPITETVLLPQIVSETTLVTAGSGYYPLGNVTTQVPTGNITLTTNGAVSAGNSIAISGGSVVGSITIGSIFNSSPTTGVIVPEGTTITGGNLTSTLILSNDVTLATSVNSIINFQNPGEGLTVDITSVDPSTGAILSFKIQSPGNGEYRLNDTIGIILISSLGVPSFSATFTIDNLSTIYTNGIPASTLTDVTGPVKFSFVFLPSLDENTALNARYSLGYQADNNLTGAINNLKISGSGGIYEDVKAPIFFNRQADGYDNQKDYQNMQNRDAQGNIIGGSPIEIEMLDPAGTNYSTLGGINSPTAPEIGTGTGLTVNFTADGSGVVQTITIGTNTYSQPNPAKNYNVGDIIELSNISAPIKARAKIIKINSEIYLIENTQSVIFDNSDYNALSNNVNINRSSSHRYLLSYGSQQNTPNNFALVVTQSYFPTSVSGTFPERADVPDSNYTTPSSVNSRYGGTKLTSLNYNVFTPSGSVGPAVQLPIQPVNALGNEVFGINNAGFRVVPEFIDGSTTSSFDQTLPGQGKPSWRGDSRQQSGSSTIDKHPIYMARFENSYEQLNMYDSYQFNIDQLIQVPFENIAGSEVTPNSITIDGSNENKKVVSSVFEPKRKVSVSYLNPKTIAIDYTTMTVGNFNILSGATEFLTINSNAKSRVSGSLRYQYELGNSPYTSSAFQTEDTIQMVTGSNEIPVPGSAGNFVPNRDLVVVTSPIITNPSSFSGTFTGLSIQSTSGGTGATADVTFFNSVVTLVRINQTGEGYNIGGSIFISFQSINAANGKSIVSQNIIITILTGDLGLDGFGETIQGFLLSGSLTTDNGIGNNIGVVGAQIRDVSISASPTGTYSNLPTISSGAGTGMIVQIYIGPSGPTSIDSFGIQSGGSGYSIGDTITIQQSILAGIGVTVVAGQDLVSAPLTTADLTGGGTPYMVNFNPSPVSASFEVVPNSQKLLVGGPQLALYHTYNSIVSQSLFNTNLPQTANNNKGAGTLLWTTSGSDPANSNNYMTWTPDGSDATSYQDTNIPFSIERGDIIRVEGIKNIEDAATNSSRSVNIIEDFTVERMLPYYYSSSFDDNSQGRDQLDFAILPADTNVYNFTTPGTNLTLGPGSTNAFTGIIGGALKTNGNPGEIKEVDVVTNTGTGYNGTYYPITSVTPAGGTGGEIQITSLASSGVPGSILIRIGTGYTGGSGYNVGDVIAYGGSGASGATATITELTNNIELFRDGSQVTDIGQPNGSVQSGGTVKIVCSANAATAPGFLNMVLTGGGSFKYGDVIKIPASAINNIQQYQSFSTGLPTATMAGTLEITLNNQSLGNEGFNNDFTIGVDVNSGTEGTSGAAVPSGSQVDYHLYEKGEVAFTADTFIQVSPDPVTTLNGLLLGEIKKFTVRRQIEADDKVMLQNVNPPSGSLGVQTQSGQGFLIPNDFSEVQKSNALNIINQLKAKNAFDKPNEPGITDGGTNISVEGSGSSTIINIP